LVKPVAVPSEMMPPTVRVLALTVTVREPAVEPSETVPVPRLRFLVPVKVKFPFQICALLVVSVWLAANSAVLSRVPALMVTVPLPSAVALLMFSVPEFRVAPASPAVRSHDLIHLWFGHEAAEELAVGRGLVGLDLRPDIDRRRRRR
jgi:hypothetical protein